MPMERAVNVRLPEDLYRRLKHKAAADGRTASGLVRYLLARAVAASGQATGGELEQKQNGRTT